MKTGLVEKLIQQGRLNTPSAISAFKRIKRIDFLPFKERIFADQDFALPIGFHQTISQPSVVAFMLEELEVKEGDKILDVGAGSGWTAALLAELTGRKGKVIAFEIVPELAEFARKNVEKYGFLKEGRVEVVIGSAENGCEKEAPFDRILCSASLADDIPLPWKRQLKTGGKIVASVRSSILVLEKKDEKSFKEKEFPGFSFVPFIKK